MTAHLRMPELRVSHLRVIVPGLATTVQDPGRPGFQRLGIPVSGALDA
jgi:antagonist of KipI